MTMRPLTDEEHAATVEPLRQRKAAYQMIFSGPPGQTVKDDLSRFCRADRTCFDADPRKHAVLEGRREVWLRIQEHLNLTAEQLAVLYRAVVPELEGDHDNDDGRPR